ncbi:MAG: transporter substrate-binding domain-containing protein [Bifidobacteriaceae bacterium]|jgi:polar amino acid transport system substrate-binding protein|nr:transporter substrate-binding domain-containing protein [Bifidobacteriaceae bacterium]
MRTQSLRLTALTWLTVGILGLSACTSGGDTDPDSGTDQSASSATDSLPQLVKEGQLTVCTNPPYLPFEGVEDGQVVGFDLDLMNEVAKDLGVTMSARETPFESIESAASLDIGDCDVGASGLTINADRQAKADFSESYYQSAMGLLVPAGSAITSIETIGQAMVGVQQGTTGEQWAAENLPSGQVKQYEHLGDQITALQTGEVSGIVNDVPVLNPYAKDGQTVIEGLSDGEAFGFMVKKGNSALVDQINQTLTRIKQDGTYDQLVTKWFTNAPAAE